MIRYNTKYIIIKPYTVSVILLWCAFPCTSALAVAHIASMWSVQFFGALVQLMQFFFALVQSVQFFVLLVRFFVALMWLRKLHQRSTNFHSTPFA